MKDNNKELIDLIKDGLKNAEELPYKEGAWEAYKAKYEPARKVHRLVPLWVAAAIAAVVGFTFLLNTGDESLSTESVNVANVEQGTNGKQDAVSDKTVEPDENLETDRLAMTSTDESNYQTPPVEGSVTTINMSESISQPVRSVLTLEGANLESFELVGIGQAPTLTREIKAADVMVFKDTDAPMSPFDWGDDLIEGEQVDPNFAYQNDATRNLSPKKMRLTDRFELGAFVSPSTTDRSFDLGGGLVFAYRFNDKVAIRTGASFNQYEVGMLSSQVREVHEEKVMQSAPVANSDKLISKEATTFRNVNLFIPNLNAVTGKVQTLDIPLEVRYNLTKQFYATGGVSYAAVLSQERFDHYEESVGIPTYSSASDSEEPVRNPVSTVSTTVQSTDDNVNTNGFGGFVNFSVGRKANIGKTMKISVEPFVKLPVGQFRRADMNYTNGGVRVITSF